ncbi:hypothetical protein [Priestia megaterium]|uniref:hypothetical protein n=1 Tax=Priestia megaterium TaxID=1404 RepID=UPI0012B9C633|nr:hypothetical protein [Priestia megaterium]
MSHHLGFDSGRKSARVVLVRRGNAPKTRAKGITDGQEGRKARAERHWKQHEDQGEQGDRQEDPGESEEEVTGSYGGWGIPHPP